MKLRTRFVARRLLSLAAGGSDFAVSCFRIGFKQPRPPFLHTLAAMRVYVCGLGVVGLAVCNLISTREASLQVRFGFAPVLAGAGDSRIVLTDTTLDPHSIIAAKMAHTLASLPGATPAAEVAPETLAARLHAAGIKVFIDCSPTNLKAAATPTARMMAMLSRGIHVISANKGPLATAMAELDAAAKAGGAKLRYSATVGGGTPMLATGHTLNMGETVTAIAGIVNGTTNFILWKMADEGWTFAAALAEAQRLGYAETDPTADIDGWDAAAKVVILANSVLNIPAKVGDVTVVGISGVTSEHIAKAKAAGNVIKLIAHASADRLSVTPTEVSAAGPLNTAGGTNAIEFTLASGAAVTLTGRGAGGPETATSIMRDIVDIAIS